MRIHLYGIENYPRVLLIHGVLTPWQIWEKQIEYFKEKYQVFVVELDGHTQETASRFVSMEAEAKKIEKYCFDRGIDEFEIVCGLSVGGAIAHILWRNQKLVIHHMVLDGAPLVPAGKLMEMLMIKSYLNMVHRLQKRHTKTLEDFKKNLIPEKYFPDYLKSVDLMSDTSVENIVHSACCSELSIDVDNHTKILYIYGTKGKVFLSKKSAKILKEYYPEAEIMCFEGDTHCYKAIYEPDIWINIVEDFMAFETTTVSEKSLADKK